MNTPREAIVRDITRPPGAASPGSSPGATIHRGGHPYQARPDTIRILKERVEGNRAMVAVEFEDTEARPWRYVFGAVQQPDGIWKAAGGAGGGGGREPQSRGPWANFGGWGWPRFLCLGGRVYGEGVAQVRLIDAVGRTIEDRVDDGIALLLSNDPVEMPCRIELRDPGGAVLAIQAWPPEPGSRPR
jgi:hypothetical protein